MNIMLIAIASKRAHIVRQIKELENLIDDLDKESIDIIEDSFPTINDDKLQKEIT